MQLFPLANGMKTDTGLTLPVVLALLLSVKQGTVLVSWQSGSGYTSRSLHYMAVICELVISSSCTSIHHRSPFVYIDHGMSNCETS